MTPQDLLLDSTKLAQLAAALANTGVTDPLERCLAEAEADVRLYTAGFVIPQETLDGWVRPIALAKAFALCNGLTADLKSAADAVLAELKAIAEGKRPNLPRAEADTTNAAAGAWGSGTQFKMRTEP